MIDVTLDDELARPGQATPLFRPGSMRKLPGVDRSSTDPLPMHVVFSLPVTSHHTPLCSIECGSTVPFVQREMSRRKERFIDTERHHHESRSLDGRRACAIGLPSLPDFSPVVAMSSREVKKKHKGELGSVVAELGGRNNLSD